MNVKELRTPPAKTGLNPPISRGGTQACSRWEKKPLLEIKYWGLVGEKFLVQASAGAWGGEKFSHRDRGMNHKMPARALRLAEVGIVDPPFVECMNHKMPARALRHRSRAGRSSRHAQ